MILNRRVSVPASEQHSENNLTDSQVRPGFRRLVAPIRCRQARRKLGTESFERRGIAAAVINSTLSPAEQQARIRRVAAGDLNLAFNVPGR